MDYEKALERLEWNINQLEKFINIHIDNIEFKETDQDILKGKKTRLEGFCEQFVLCVKEYEDFLRANKSSTTEMETTLLHQKVDGTIRHSHLVIDKLNERLQKLTEPTNYVKTLSQVGSNRSTTSSALLRSKAKAESAKVRQKFSEQEARIRKEKADRDIQLEYEQAQLLKKRREVAADLQLQMDMIAQEKAVAEAEAELSAIQELSDQENLLDIDVPEISNEDLVRHFINNQASPADIPGDNEIAVGDDKIANTSLNVHAPTYSPKAPKGLDETLDVTKFLLKKELSISRLSNFDDRPENYVVWKSSFKNIITELSVNPSEEVDLLSKYLGPESKKHATSMRFANVNEPDSGLNKIWNRLDERYGSPEQIERSLKDRLLNFPQLSGKDHLKLYDLSDLLAEIMCIKKDPKYKLVLAYLDSSSGVNPVVAKLPQFMRTKWIDHATKYKSKNLIMYPTFDVFAKFVHDLSVRYNDPSFSFDAKEVSNVDSRRPTIKNRYTPGSKDILTLTAKKTELGLSQNAPSHETCDCPIHGDGCGHRLKDCRTFAKKCREEKKEIIIKNGMCFKCLSGRHLARDCTLSDVDKIQKNHGGERDNNSSNSNQINNKCTQICGEFKGKSCAKTVLINITRDNNPGKVLKAYAIIDDQSNRSLARSEFFEYFKDNSQEQDYTISTCTGDRVMTGRRGVGYKIQSLDREYIFNLPLLIECNQIPNVRQEIPTPQVASQYSHLVDLTDKIPEYNKTADILLLIGRDLLSVHHVLEQRLGKDYEPYAQKLKLGWVIVGESCLGLVHKTDMINVNKTNILHNGRPTCMELCHNNFRLSTENTNEMVAIGTDIFEQKSNDDLPGLSQMEREFLDIMNQDFIKTSSGHWSAPLPFMKDRPLLSNNYAQAKNRFNILDKSLKKNPNKQKDFFEFMGKIFNNQHAEKAPPLEANEECWYLPIFGIYHSKKNKLRVVFDSAAKHKGLSLNDVLLKGPDLTNNLAGVLLKFRKEKIAITGDIEQMFFNFHVHEKDRNYLRFLWYDENDVNKPMIEYRMRVHVFGNKPSPAVASYGLRKSACTHEHDENLCDSVCNFIKKHFYVDDGLISLCDEQSAIKLIKETQTRLLEHGNIRLHKLSSNSLTVLENLPPNDVVDNIIQDMELDSDVTQRSLGLYWKLIPDIFTYKVSDEEKPFTKRGILSVINSIYDPLGFVAPVVLGGKLLLRKLVTDKGLGWDDPLPPVMENDWKIWRYALKDLEKVEIPRCFSDLSVGNAVCRELHVFSDASKEAVGAVAYIKVYDVDHTSRTSFVLGKSKLAPNHGHTIPRLELCGALLATELAAYIVDNLDVTFNRIRFYTDSQVVLGYLFNKTRKFFVYVSNRVDKILHRSNKDQWSYVPTGENPADMATRHAKAADLSESIWLTGPTSFLDSFQINDNPFGLVDENNDHEIRPHTIDILKTCALETLGSKRFTKFSKWTSVLNAICTLKQIVQKRHDKRQDKVDILKNSEVFLINLVQTELYSTEMDCLRLDKPVNRNSVLFNLSPYLDSFGLIRVGGRLKNLKVDYEKNPIIIPSKHHIATLIVRHFHEKAQHQGRHITEGLVRSSGYWIIGGKRLISSIIHNCIRCKILRGKTQTQIMSDLPEDRISPCPPFTYIGIDTFGPWDVVARRTRGGLAHSKRWAIIFCCMVTRGIHIEVIEDMSTSSFINSLRRFIAIRGPVKQIRSDRGSNFVGTVKELHINAINVEDGSVKSYLNKEGILWLYNTPYSSHMGGSWERLIGITRRILDNMLRDIGYKNFTHEVLITFMAEVTTIVNGRPLVPVSNDPDNPFILSPNNLITQKSNLYVKSFDYFSKLDVKDMYKSQWRFVQILSENFWKHWKNQYLTTLQVRRKWQNSQENIKVGDIVLVKEAESHRNDWPLGIIKNIFPSQDKKVRKVEIRMGKTQKTCVRPITQIVFLLSYL